MIWYDTNTIYNNRNTRLLHYCQYMDFDASRAKKSAYKSGI